MSSSQLPNGRGDVGFRERNFPSGKKLHRLTMPPSPPPPSSPFPLKKKKTNTWICGHQVPHPIFPSKTKPLSPPPYNLILPFVSGVSTRATNKLMHSRCPCRAATCKAVTPSSLTHVGFKGLRRSRCSSSSWFSSQAWNLRQDVVKSTILCFHILILWNISSE